MSLSTFVGKAAVKTQAFLIKHGPRIMSVCGAGMTIGGAVMACRATLKAYEVVDHHKEVMAVIEEARETSIANSDELFTEKDYKQAKFETYMSTAFSFVKLYAPSVAVGLSGVGLMQSAFHIMD